MINRQLSLALTVVLFATSAAADNLAGAERLLCSTLQATVCFADDQCAIVSPAELNIPQFIEVDARTRVLATTAASGENRRTTAATVNREEGKLVLQGYENGRAFSLLVQESTGQASFASVADDRSLIVFAACTPVPGR